MIGTGKGRAGTLGAVDDLLSGLVEAIDGLLQTGKQEEESFTAESRKLEAASGVVAFVMDGAGSSSGGGDDDRMHEIEEDEKFRVCSPKHHRKNAGPIGMEAGLAQFALLRPRQSLQDCRWRSASFFSSSIARKISSRSTLMRASSRLPIRYATQKHAFVW